MKPIIRWYVLHWGIAIAAATLAGICARAEQSSNTVKITPLGARTGELCAVDRALIFEDPTGVRILYDPGVTTAGGEDARLGDVDVIIVSHNHFDHMGTGKLTMSPDHPNAVCTTRPALARTGNTVVAEIAAAKNSAVVGNINMGVFLGKKIEAIRGMPTDGCIPTSVQSEIEIVVPRSSPCTGGTTFGGFMTVTRAAGSPGVRINMVAALHTDSVFNTTLHLSEPLGSEMADNGLSAYNGLAAGFVLTFTNGLKAYLTGDTGPISDMAMIVRGLYHVNLAVANVDGAGTMGPEEGAYAMKQLVQPAAIIPSHAEYAVTDKGRVIPNTRMARFIGLIGDDIPVYLPLSGRTMLFDGDANCVAGCNKP
jgi:L-ascorbate metabolism protein UlaG (beta-lactamase superfamily)